MKRSPFTWIQRHLGEYLMLIAVVHMLLGLMDYPDAVRNTVEAGWFTSTITHRDGEAMWFMTLGPVCFLLGLIVRQQLRETGTIPAYYGIWMIVASIVSIAVLPANGVWSIVIAGLIALSISRGRSQLGMNVRQGL